MINQTNSKWLRFLTDPIKTSSESGSLFKYQFLFHSNFFHQRKFKWNRAMVLCLKPLLLWFGKQNHLIREKTIFFASSIQNNDDRTSFITWQLMERTDFMPNKPLEYLSSIPFSLFPCADTRIYFNIFWFLDRKYDIISGCWLKDQYLCVYFIYKIYNSWP